MISSITPNLILNKITHHPINRERTFFSNALWGVRIGKNKKPHECGATLLFHLKNFASSFV
jgi:hypothetical protein